MTSIFMSYRRADSTAHTGRIYDQLVNAFGERHLFKDVEDIPAGEDFRSVLDKALTAADVVLVIMGPQWVMITDDSGHRRLNDPHDFVRIEVESALKRTDVLVIPVLVDNAVMPDPASLPDSLKDLAYRNSVVVRNDPDFHHDINLLIQAIQKRVGSSSNKRLPLIFGGLAALLAIFALALILLSSRGGPPPQPQQTQAALAATTASTDAPTKAPTEKPTEKPTDAPTTAPTEKPTEVSTTAPTAEATEAEVASADLTPTVLYPDGRLVRLLYNDTSFYLYNPNATMSLSPIRFEGVDADGKPVNVSYAGTRWTQLFANVFRNSCAAIEPDTLLRFLNPSTCSAVNAKVTLIPASSHFWRSSSGAVQFTVIWNDEEIGRCPVADGTTECQVRLPPA
ncbi:MAG: TIR domain-containing protein [Anaerolineae bacterium]